MPGDQNAQLDKDVALMKAAGLNVVRMGESTWSLWEPEDGHFEYAWMDRVVDAMGKAGIKVILGTPTYSIPAWMARQHPEILAARLNGGMYGGPPLRTPTACARTWTPTRRPTASTPSGSSATSWPTTRTTPPSSAGSSTTKPPATTPPIPTSSSASSTISRRSSSRPKRSARLGSSTTGARTSTPGKTCPPATARRAPATSWSGRAGARCA